MKTLHLQEMNLLKNIQMQISRIIPVLVQYIINQDYKLSVNYLLQ